MTTPAPAQPAETLSLEQRVNEAIAVVESSRQTHVDWAEWLEAATPGARCGDPSCGRDHHADVGVAGDAAHHRECIAGYDKVLAVLRSMETEVRSSIARDIEASGLIYNERGIRAHFAAIARGAS